MDMGNTPRMHLDLPIVSGKDDDECPRCQASGEDWKKTTGANGWENWCTACGYAESGT